MSQIFFTRALVKHTEIKFMELDNNLAEIIQQLLQENPLGINPENQVTPVQAFFMDMIKQKMNPPIQVKEIKTDSTGKFV